MYVYIFIDGSNFNFNDVCAGKAPSIGEPGAVHRQRGSQRGHGLVLTAILGPQGMERQMWRDTT